MARERYLVGVSKEELEYTPPQPQPVTPKDKWDNFWYHYKWPTIVALFIITVAVVVIVQAATKTRADYTVCVVAQQELSFQATERLKAEFTAVGRDRNGDGKVVVQVQALNIALTPGGTAVNAGRQTVMAHIVARDVYLFALDPSYYNETLAPLFEEGTCFFAPLSVQSEDISADGTYWNWKNSPLLEEADMQEIDVWQAVPSELYFGVRNLAGNSAKAAEEQQAYTELLQAFITAHS